MTMDSTMTLGEMLTLAEAAPLANTTHGALRVNIHYGNLHGVKMGNTWLVSRAELERFIAARQEKGAGNGANSSGH